MENFSQDSLRFWGMVHLPQLQLTGLQEIEMTKKQKKVRKRSDTIATEEVNIIPRFVTNSCLSSKCLMLSLSVQCFKFLDLHMNYWETSSLQGCLLQNWIKRRNFLEEQATGGHFPLMKLCICCFTFWQVQHKLMNVAKSVSYFKRQLHVKIHSITFFY